MNPRLAWLWLFVLVNVIAALMMWNLGEILGGTGTRVDSQSDLIWATLLVVVPYFVILGPVFGFISKIQFRSVDFGLDGAVLGRRIGQMLVVLQVLFVVFNLTEGVNIAGSGNTRSDSSFSILWVLIPVDALFIVYYGLYRENKWFYPNLIIWTISNFSRGWMGIFLLSIFLEWCRSVRNKRISISGVLLALAVTLALYPIFLSAKWLVRASASAGLSLPEVIDGVANILSGSDYFSLIGDGVMHLIVRIQSVSMFVETMRLSDVLQAKFSAGEFSPFWMEGLHGLAIDRLFFGKRPMYIGVAFTAYGDFGSGYDVGDWNTSLGYMSWLFITPYLVPLYIAYTIFLGGVAFWMLKKCGSSLLAHDLLWYTWLVYLLAPWVAAFIGFIYALFIFFIIKMVVSKIPIVRFTSKPKLRNVSYDSIA